VTLNPCPVGKLSLAVQVIEEEEEEEEEEVRDLGLRFACFR
jgi:hypothetical protein